MARVCKECLYGLGWAALILLTLAVYLITRFDTVEFRYLGY